ncbi:hypothetical protein EMPS_09600 [Entomortierella parvispora]|uniref:Uncharacterized protein n=1 Tax=Entomortierella parvispora TaxID=205924 RepID=A0A9P3HIH9_9FUNG|nr:hypothetical protein EMPS_09600 [Entomortierella parvispora]
MSSIDKKQPMAGWGVPADEQQTFGNQAPFADSQPSSSAIDGGQDETVPFVAHQPFHPPALEHPSVRMQIPSDAPPVYTPKPTAPPPSEPVFRNPQAPNAQPSVPATVSAAPRGPYSPPAPQEIPYQQVAPPQVPFSPSQNQSYQPPFVSQAPMPTNYGAINTPYPNSNNYAPLPPGPLPHHPAEDTPIRRRRRKMKAKGGSCCSCCCFMIILIILMCWYFSKSFDGILDGSCWAPANAPKSVKTQLIEATPTVGFKIEVIDGIVGNILVQEYESDDKTIKVTMTMRASSTNLLNKMIFTNTTDPKLPYDNQFTTIHLEGSESDKRKLLRGNCAQVDVDILYPVGIKRKPVVTAGKLTLLGANGEMNIAMQEAKDAVTILDTFHAKLANGEINFHNLAVSSLTKFELANGRVLGTLKTSGAVEAALMSGPVDLSIDTTPLQSNWNNNELFVDVFSMSGAVTVDLANPFHGHFHLGSTIGKPAIWVAPGHNDTVQFNTADWDSVKGWVQHNSDPEPTTKLPLIKLRTLAGAVKLNVINKG